ncbi:hypothetical protein BOTBODRAFT_62862 [Botryobasidium botryosum FD-172 SS1]|uniref:Uncharacterized protein n=1 Tax=Botryobasidium botryosum (strain FD-172 SS1) TaxID=930990 RepID=A0A067N5U1_BOTB1|nr:hypothetical protein BOTBODRAFT_62862 [Botryobasidium botryosum FD-172 SS1]
MYWGYVGSFAGQLGSLLSPEPQLRPVRPRVTALTNIHVPNPSSLFRAGPGAGSLEGAEKEEEGENISDFLEWVGMVAVGSQRLQVNDRVDPYLALYSPPAGSAPGGVTHVRWTGVLSASFVRRVLGHLRVPADGGDDDMAAAMPVSASADSDHGQEALPLLSVTGHGFVGTPGGSAGGRGAVGHLQGLTWCGVRCPQGGWLLAET